MALAKRFSFSGSRLVTRFAGTTLSVRLDEAGPQFYSVRVDGTEQPALETAAGVRTYVLARGLPAGEHDVVLTRRTEALLGVSQFLAFEGAPLVATPAPYQRAIEIVGDSISAGFGVLGDSPDCPFSAVSTWKPSASRSRGRK